MCNMSSPEKHFDQEANRAQGNPRKRKAVAKIPPSEGDARSCGAEVIQLPKRADGSVDEVQVWQAFNNAHHIIEGQQQRINQQQAEIDEANAERKQDRERLFEQSKRIADIADKAVDALAAKPVTVLPPAVLPEALCLRKGWPALRLIVKPRGTLGSPLGGVIFGSRSSCVKLKV